MEYVKVDESVANLFKGAREERGFSQTELEKKTEQEGYRVSGSAISKLEQNNMNYTSKKNIISLLKVFHTNELLEKKFSIIPKRGSSHVINEVTGQDLLDEFEKKTGRSVKRKSFAYTEAPTGEFDEEILEKEVVEIFLEALSSDTLTEAEKKELENLVLFAVQFIYYNRS